MGAGSSQPQQRSVEGDGGEAAWGDASLASGRTPVSKAEGIVCLGGRGAGVGSGVG